MLVLEPDVVVWLDVALVSVPMVSCLVISVKSILVIYRVVVNCGESWSGHNEHQ